MQRSDRPTTQHDIATALRSAGILPGGIAVVHTSMSALGWVVGGALAVVRALQSTLGPQGTIVMPAQTGIGDPAFWREPPVPEEWWSTIRAEWPAFDPAVSPLRRMGATAECFARLDGVVHSGHPAVGFVARGPQATELMLPHDLDAGLGNESPLGRLYTAEADIVLLGVGHGNNTSLHLAEARALGDQAPQVEDGAPLMVDGERQWVTYHHVEFDDADFVELGEAYAAAEGTEWRVRLGPGSVSRIPMPELVDFGTEWLARRRGGASDGVGEQRVVLDIDDPAPPIVIPATDPG